MSGVNKTITIGRLGQDPEIKALPNGKQVANFSVATSEKWKDKTSGDMVEKTEWHNMVAYGRLAEIIGQYLKKGSNAYFEGSSHTRKWQDKEGNDRYTHEIKVKEMQMLDSRTSTDSQAQEARLGQPQPQAQQQSAPVAPDFDDERVF